MKGGVGKTTLSLNLAYEYARLGYRVLCLDLDGQCNLTSFFENEKLKARKKHRITGIGDVLDANAVFWHEPENDRWIRNGILLSRYPNLHFVCGSE